MLYPRYFEISSKALMFVCLTKYLDIDVAWLFLLWKNMDNMIKWVKGVLKQVRTVH